MPKIKKLVLYSGDFFSISPLALLGLDEGLIYGDPEYDMGVDYADLSHDDLIHGDSDIPNPQWWEGAGIINTKARGARTFKLAAAPRYLKDDITVEVRIR